MTSRSLLALLTAALCACGDDEDDDDLRCGAGTEQVGDECLPVGADGDADTDADGDADADGDTDADGDADACSGGELDGSFGDGGHALGMPTGGDFASTALEQPDGKVVLVGVSYGAVSLARYGTDGRLDPELGDGGWSTTAIGLWHADETGAALRDDGSIVVVGHTGVVQPDDTRNKDAFVAVFDATGTLDEGFGQGGSALVRFGPGEDAATAVAIDAGGNIVLGGSTQMEGGSSELALARFSPDGEVDATFGPDGDGRVTTAVGAHGWIEALAIDAEGRIVVAGASGASGEDYDGTIARFLPDGTLDPDFGDAGVFRHAAASGSAVFTSLALQSDGAIVAAGAEWGSGALLARLTAAGALDDGFGDGGTVVAGGWFQAVAIQADGRILAAGGTEGDVGEDHLVARFLADGTPDPDFGAGGRSTIHLLYGGWFESVLAGRGGVVAAGSAMSPPLPFADGVFASAFAVARFCP